MTIANLCLIAYCTNACDLFERSGFQVLCGRDIGPHFERASVVPHAIAVYRGAYLLRPTDSGVNSTRALRHAFADVPVPKLVDPVPSDREQEILGDCGVNISDGGVSGLVSF